MYPQKLKHKGHEITLTHQSRSFYTHTKLEGDKTLFQVLFEMVVNGEKIALKRLVTKYKPKSPYINSSTIKYCLEKIERAIKQSPNEKTRQLQIRRVTQRDRGDPKIRTNPQTRYPKWQKAMLTDIIQKMHANDNIPTNREIEKAFHKKLAKLKHPRLPLDGGTIRKIKRQLSLNRQTNPRKQKNTRR